MTEDEVTELFMWFESHSYSATRETIDDPFTFSLYTKVTDWGSKSGIHKEWYCRFMAKCYLNPQHIELESN